MGLFGESTDELIKKEIEAKRKYSARHGVEVNANIKDMKLADNINTKVRPKMNLYQKTVFITGLILAVIVFTIFGSMLYTDLTGGTNYAINQENYLVPSDETSDLTIGQKNALKKAGAYLDYSAFSYSGLIKQLKYEGFSTEEATYAVNNCGADWNEQAAVKAQAYLDYSSFSRSSLIEQLEYEGFTKKQAEHGVNAVGY